MAGPIQTADGAAPECPQCHSSLKVFPKRGTSTLLALCVYCMKAVPLPEPPSTSALVSTDRLS